MNRTPLFSGIIYRFKRGRWHPDANREYCFALPVNDSVSDRVFCHIVNQTGKSRRPDAAMCDRINIGQPIARARTY